MPETLVPHVAGPDAAPEPHLAVFRDHYAGAPHAPPSAPSAPPSAPPPEAGAVPRPSLPSDWRDSLTLWMGGLRDDPRARAVALGVVLLIAGLLWYRVGLAGAGEPPSSPVAAPASSTTPTSAAAASGAPASGPVYVHVAGAVRAPGLYRLKDGARVADALRAAGGAVPEADTDRLNLAALVHDGEQVLVPRVGEAVPAPLPAPSTAGTPGAATGVVNLNTASVADLEALPGIGPVIAGAIVDERQRGGPFATVDDLLRVPGIGESRLEELRPHVAV